MKRIAFVLMAAVLCAIGARASEESGAKASGPHFKLAMVTTDKYSRDEKAVFPTDFPRIFAVYQIDAAHGTKVKAVWIAEKVPGLEAKSKITESESTFSAKGEYMGAFSCPRPAQGWAPGSYVVELSLDGALRKTLAFRVEK